jgi:FAD:protein FMN transferase
MPLRSPAAERPTGTVRRARPLLGTLVEISVSAAPPVDRLHAAVDAAFAAIGEIHALMSYQDRQSEVSRLNRLAVEHPQPVDARTFRVLQAALEFARRSGGAFTPCVWPRLHGEESSSWRDVDLLDGGLVGFRRPLRIDLSGIAKGFAVDAAVECLQALGLENVVVNAGGDLRVSGPQQQEVRLRNPAAPSQHAHTVLLRNAALATSAAYFAPSALINGHSGEPYAGNSSVSVRAPTCMSADALTKVVLFADTEVAERCLLELQAEAQLLVAEPFPAGVRPASIHA